MISPQLKEQVSKVISYSQGIENPQIDELLSQWEKAKSEFVNSWLGGSLILEAGHVQFSLSEEAKKSRLNMFLEWVYQINPHTQELISFIQNIGIEDFYKNSLSAPYIINMVKFIPTGSKVVKSFKHFIKDKKLLEELQNKASEIIQENKIEGTLCFSVHPLDFLSSSENQFHWRSCHALDGEYRAGNLSYMTDKSTIMCYLKSDKETCLPHFPKDVTWNNKKWRCLLFVNNSRLPDVCFAGRQYPFFSQDALNIIREKLLEIMPTEYFWLNKWSDWSNGTIENVFLTDGSASKNIEDSYYYLINNHIYSKEELIQDAPASTHFNDLLYSSCYKPYYMHRNINATGKIFKTITIGNAVRCLRCGQNVINTKDTMMCLDCELEYGDSESDDYRRCDYCDSRYFAEDGYWVDGDHICPHCFENSVFTCVNCGERYYNIEQKYSNSLGGFVCRHCYNKIEEEN